MPRPEVLKIGLIRNIVVKVGADISGLSSGMTKAQDEMKHNVKKLIDAGEVLVAGAAAAFTALAAQGVEAASNLNEIQSSVNTVFGSSAASVDAWAKSAIKSYGLNEESALQYAETMKGMFDGMGVTGQQANQMSESIADLSGDMASFYNISSSDAFSKLQAGIEGQTKPLREFGINMSTANLQAFALSEGITTPIKSMSEGEATVLRYNYLIQATSLSQGNFIKTSGSYANQMRVFQANMQEMTVALGQAVIPIIEAALPWINMFMQYITTAATDLTKWIDSLLGLKYSATEATSSSNALADSQNDVADAINNVTAASAKAQKAVSGLDELNILQSTTSAADAAAANPANDALDTPQTQAPALAANVNVSIIGEPK